MKIKKLELLGFKSFVDRTVVHFDHDVIGIVGPNGCGKSNIVDAIRWCMGEQSAKHLRGRSMEDVIFNGSESRGPNEFSEVTLTFENDDPSELPLELQGYAELAVTRRLYRTGESEYLINKTQVRLKDVTDLFLGTGVGTKAYSIVEQGKIGLIVSAKPEDRRLLIEEAAGITKFKSKKKQAERKMELTQQNLLRVGDIIAEIDRNLGSLKRQAAKAERYLGYRSELEDLQLYEASHRYLEHSAWVRIESAAVEGHTLAAEEARTRLVTRETELETARLEAHSAESALEEATSTHFAAENAVRTEQVALERARDRRLSLEERDTQAERDIEHLRAQRESLTTEVAGYVATLDALREDDGAHAANLAMEEGVLSDLAKGLAEAETNLADVKRALANADRDIAAAEAKLGGFDRRKEDLEDRQSRLQYEDRDLVGTCKENEARKARLEQDLADLRDGKVTTAEERGRLEERLSELRLVIVESEQQLEAAKNEHQRKRSRLQALLELQARLDGVGAGTKSLLEGKATGVLGLVADHIQLPAEYTQALAGLLGPRLQEVVVSSEERGVELLHELAQKSRGRATIIPIHPRHAAGGLPLPAHAAGRAVHMLSLISCPKESESLVTALVGDAILADDEALASQLCRELHVPVVTREGTFFHPDGRVSGGAGDTLAAGMIDLMREVKTLTDEVTSAGQIAEQKLSHHQELRAEIAGIQTALERARQEAHLGELAFVRGENDLKAVALELDKATKRRAALAEELHNLGEALAQAEAERAEAERILSEAKAVQSTAGEAVIERETHVGSARAHVDEQRQKVTEVRVVAAGLREKVLAATGAKERLDRSIVELEERERRLEKERNDVAEQLGQTFASAFRHKEALELALDAASIAETTLTTAKEAYEGVRSGLMEREAELKDLRGSAEETRENLTKHEMVLREHQMSLEHLEGSVRERFRGLQLARIIGDYHMRPPPDSDTHARVNELGHLLERMGSVNLDAMKEHTDAEERFTFYSTQKADLDKALSDLNLAILEMNKESKRLFKDAFDAINQKFQEIFPKMFRGGRASLRLTDPDDMLETGIDILAQPPGKKLASIELMSGGEKALTAVSLIFAIFQIKPSPFCILDEVDAPLDEANVARYNDMIREMTDRSQFIIITHIKKTMQLVDVLYGVTMQEPGVSRLVSVKISDAAVRTSKLPAAATAVA